MVKFKIKKIVSPQWHTISARVRDSEFSRLKALSIKNKQQMGSIVVQMVRFCLNNMR